MVVGELDLDVALVLKEAVELIHGFGGNDELALAGGGDIDFFIHQRQAAAIGGEAKERITLAREEFMHALRRAEIMTSEKQNSVKLNLTKNNLAITANSPDVGEARESLAINYKGKDMAIAFNPGYLIEPLNALVTDEVYLDLIDELSPGVLKINASFLYVVMPMRLS